LSRPTLNLGLRLGLQSDAKGKIEAAQYNVKATGHVAKLRRDLSI
jgi:hypothetical protein